MFIKYNISETPCAVLETGPNKFVNNKMWANFKLALVNLADCCQQNFFVVPQIYTSVREILRQGEGMVMHVKLSTNCELALLNKITKYC